MGENLYDAAFEQREDEYPQVNEVLEPVEEEDLTTDESALLYNGYLNGSVQLGNRTIRLRTLKIGEELEASLLAARWKDTADANRALVTAYVAAAVTTVDGAPLVTMLGPNDNELEQKFDFILNNWYWTPTISAVYAEYNNLLRRVNEASDLTSKG
jgi:hypothetical protein